MAKPKSKSKLTPKQSRFVEEYIIDLNATQAAIRAGYSKRTADRIGPELLGKTWVSEAIHKAIEKRSKRTEITQDRVLNEIARYAFEEASDMKMSELKHSSKAKYLDMLCKCLGMYDRNEDKDESTQDDGFMDALKTEAPEVWEE